MTHKPLTLRGFTVITKSQMEAMHTGTLMRIRREMLAVHDSAQICDLTAEEVALLDESSTIYFKTDPRWSELYEQLKEVLGTREHWPRRGDEATR